MSQRAVPLYSSSASSSSSSSAGSSTSSDSDSYPETSSSVSTVGERDCSPHVPNQKFLIVTWNAHAVFGSVWGSHDLQVRAYKCVGDLMSAHDIVCMQETHGTPSDAISLEQDFKEHRHFGSFCADQPGAGGVVTSVRKSLREQFENVAFSEVVKGRITPLGLYGPQASLQIINVHFVPGLPHGVLLDQFRR
eukprot:6448293-Pyramimonas_sp.AAC.1